MNRLLRLMASLRCGAFGHLEITVIDEVLPVHGRGWQVITQHHAACRRCLRTLNHPKSNTPFF